MSKTDEKESTDFEERLHNLESRVNYLESEVGESLEAERFERDVSRIIDGRDYSLDVSTGNPYSEYHAEFTDISVEQLNQARDRLDGTDYLHWAIIETSEGLGFEVWTNNLFE